MQASLQAERENLIGWIQTIFTQLNLKGTVVFDGAHRRDEQSGLSYPSPLEVAYTPKNESADAFIIEKLSLLKNCKTSIVVTNDQGLRRHAQALGARTESNESFLQWLWKKKSKRGTKQKILKETDAQMKRLMQIFEDRLKNGSNEDDPF